MISKTPKTPKTPNNNTKKNAPPSAAARESSRCPSHVPLLCDPIPPPSASDRFPPSTSARLPQGSPAAADGGAFAKTGESSTCSRTWKVMAPVSSLCSGLRRKMLQSTQKTRGIQKEYQKASKNAKKHQKHTKKNTKTQK